MPLTISTGKYVVEVEELPETEEKQVVLEYLRRTAEENSLVPKDAQYLGTVDLWSERRRVHYILFRGYVIEHTSFFTGSGRYIGGETRAYRLVSYRPVD